MSNPVHISRPENHQHCLTQATDHLSQSDGFFIITLKGHQITMSASINSPKQDEMIGSGILRFIEQRDLEIERLTAEASNEIH
jgi:hypothetical protein